MPFRLKLSSALVFAFSALSLVLPGCSPSTPSDSGSGGTQATIGGGENGGAPNGGTANGGSAGGQSGGTGGGSLGDGGSSQLGGSGPNGGGGPVGGAPGAGGTMDAAGGGSGVGGQAATGGSSGVGCEEADLFCADFEAIAVGELPMGDTWVPRDVSCGSQNFSMEVSSEQARGASSKSLKVTNHSYASCRLAAAFPESDDFWIRAFIYWEASVDFDNKEILAIDLHPPSGLGKDDPALRFGDRSKDPCIGAPGPQVTMIGLGNGEVTGCDDKTPTPKGAWHCFEAHVRQSGNLLVNTYVNGAAIEYQSTGKPLVDTVDLGGPPVAKLNHVRLGFFTHNSSGQGDVYIDDVGISTTRLGCGSP